MASTKLLLFLVIVYYICLFEITYAASIRKTGSSAIETQEAKKESLLKRTRRNASEMTKIQTITHNQKAVKFFLKWLRRHRGSGRNSTINVCIDAYLRLYGKHKMREAVKACM